MSTNARLRAARAAFSASAFSRASLARLCFSSPSFNLIISLCDCYDENRLVKYQFINSAFPKFVCIYQEILFERFDIAEKFLYSVLLFVEGEEFGDVRI